MLLVQTFNTDFSYLPLVVDFKHRSTPAALFTVEFALITASEGDTLNQDAINKAFEQVSNDKIRARIGADVYNAADADHPLFYMCLKAFDFREGTNTGGTIVTNDDPTGDQSAEAELWDDTDGTRKQICNIDLNGYIGDLSIFNTGGTTFGQGLIYEDRVFLNREIFAGKF